MACERAGEGPPLLLLHGAISDARIWRRQLEGLAGELSVAAWDAPGFGRSSPIAPPFGMDDWVDVLAGFIEALDLPPAHVLGHSFGGALALALYARRPEAVRSLILAGAYAGWKGSLDAADVRRRLAMATRTAELPADETYAAWLPGFFTPDVPAAVVRELGDIAAAFHPAGLRLMAAAMADTDLRPVLPTIAVPTLLLWGERDLRAPLPVAERMLAAIPRARLAVIPGAAHVSNLERPEAFNAAVREFCRGG